MHFDGRSRGDIELEQQNAELLKAMNARSRQQVQLQQTVEGLSVAAISYVVRLLTTFSGPMGLERFMSEKYIKAAIVVLSVAAVAFVVRRIRRRHSN